MSLMLVFTEARELHNYRSSNHLYQWTDAQLPYSIMRAPVGQIKSSLI
ncbi:MAG: hypothetical protein KME29_11365 [Calothrix sp. FI2-JRJ7]|nr:hypothetical protein [Calothrix sp. FI2-JRJ7]